MRSIFDAVADDDGVDLPDVEFGDDGVDGDDGDDGVAEDEGFVVPPVRLPAVAELTASAGAAVLLDRFRAAVRWLGTGRSLETSGQLTLADSRELAGLLDVDQRFVRNARSASDLPDMALVVEWAKAVQLVRVSKSRLVPEKSAQPLLREPLELWDRAFESFVDLGPYVTGRSGHPSVFGEQFAEAMPVLWMSLYTAGGVPIPQELLFEMLREVVVEQFGFQDDDDAATDDAAKLDVQQRLWRRDVVDVLDALETLGAVRREQSTNPEERAEIVRLAGRDDADFTLVGLTGLGLWAVNRVLREEGVTAPLVGESAGEDFAVVCPGLVHAPPETAGAELDAWFNARDRASALAELVRFVESTPEPTYRLFGLSALGRTGDDGVEAVRGIRARGGVPGAVATAWLVDQTAVDQSSVTEQEMMLGLVDQLAVLCELGDLVDGLAAFTIDDQIDMVRRIATVDHPNRLDVLAEIAREHPDTTVVDVAGRALDKARAVRP